MPYIVIKLVESLGSFICPTRYSSRDTNSEARLQVYVFQ